ncbi:MAG: hypothetical protein MZV64_31720 [Ignavibacteriales bacterium]|nr:hypothetical protein [Ignavibacteriales bacterium]
MTLKPDIACRDVHAGLIEGGAVHLGGNEALPDEVVDGELVVIQIGPSAPPGCSAGSWA